MNHGLVTWPGLSLCLFSQFAGIPMSFSTWGSRTYTHTDTHCFKKHLSMKINLITIHYAHSHVKRERSVDNEYIISLKAPKKIRCTKINQRHWQTSILTNTHSHTHYMNTVFYLNWNIRHLILLLLFGALSPPVALSLSLWIYYT